MFCKRRVASSRGHRPQPATRLWCELLIYFATRLCHTTLTLCPRACFPQRFQFKRFESKIRSTSLSAPLFVSYSTKKPGIRMKCGLLVRQKCMGALMTCMWGIGVGSLARRPWKPGSTLNLFSITRPSGSRSRAVSGHRPASCPCTKAVSIQPASLPHGLPVHLRSGHAQYDHEQQWG